MKTKLSVILMIAAAVTVMVVLLAGCGKSSEKQPEATSKRQMQGMSAEGLNYIYTAETLYTCSMHPEVATDNAAASCPECGMSLKEMSEQQVTELRASHPRGCPMCNIVVPGDSEMKKCPKCGMKLVDVADSDPHSHNH